MGGFGKQNRLGLLLGGMEGGREGKKLISALVGCS